MKHFYKIVLSVMSVVLFSCADYLDIVPDNIATIDYAFRMRVTAEQYLSTCYSYLPKHSFTSANPAIVGADEMWLSPAYTNHLSFLIARGDQNKNSPVLDYWRGGNGGKSLWEGISQCNIFLDNIKNVPDMEEKEKEQWLAEVKFLKAYYHFFLLRAYGPIPIMKKNLPISASGEEVRVFREPVDDVFDYIVELIDEAILHLPETVFDEYTELGRITLPIALSTQAKILVYAASPLFNGNTDYKNFKDHNGNHFFNQTYDSEKWEKAVNACKKAIDLAESLGYSLYEFEESMFTRDISPETEQKLTIRGIFTERWNSEIIWGNSGDLTTSLQTYTHPSRLDVSESGFFGAKGMLGVPINIVNMFYTKNGVPIDEDRNWSYNNRLYLRDATHEERFHIKEGYTTVEFNFDREPRFYGSLGFDGGIWYGHGRYDDEDTFYMQNKRGQITGKYQQGNTTETGYLAKKLDYYTNTNTNRTTYTVKPYPWTLLRLGDLYLLYAESHNELNGPSEEVFKYINKIRFRAGLKGVKESWNNHSKVPNKYTIKEGMREIIQRERTIEMMFEGQRFWDLRRWKTAPNVLNQAIVGWDIEQASAEDYYRERILFYQKFALKDYFWPISENDLIVNKNLIQNVGW